MVVGLGVGGGEVFEERVEDVVRGGVFGKVFAAERGGHAGNIDGEEFSGKAQSFWAGVWRLDCDQTAK